jgi:hypothetical protein
MMMTTLRIQRIYWSSIMDAKIDFHKQIVVNSRRGTTKHHPQTRTGCRRVTAIAAIYIRATAAEHQQRHSRRLQDCHQDFVGKHRRLTPRLPTLQTEFTPPNGLAVLSVA